MTNKKSIGTKVLSIVLALMMCISLVPVMSEIAPEAEAATAGLYDIKVELTVTNGADGWDQNDHYVNHKSNNGTGTQTAQSVGLSTGNMDEEKTHTFTYSNKGFPTSYTYNYSFGGGFTWRKLEFTLKVYASKAGASSWKEVMSGSFSDESSAFSAAKGTWTVNATSNIAAPSSISWTNTAKTITVPKSGTATGTTLAATVYDQYGVEWYQEPYYALNSSTSATSTTETISGITRTTSQANTCTVSVTNAARTWVDNGGGTSRDVYVTAYINSVKSTTTTKFTINQVQYNIKFYNDGTLINTESANQLFYYNDQPYLNGNPKKDADAQYTYIFDGWNTSNSNTTTGSPAYTNSTLPVATADASYYAHYSTITNEYKVIFQNYDGTVLQSSTVPYGNVPQYDGATPVRQGTPEYSYTFTGWEPEVSAVTGEVTYTAVYSETKNKYAVEFRNENGDTLDVQYLEYGTVPVYGGETPTKEGSAQYSYVFSGWTPEITSVTTQALYTATYDSVLNSYDVIFKNEDGTILQNSKYNYGEMPVYGGATPEKAATAEYTYTFAGWTPGVVSVTGNAEYTAVFSSAANEYKVYYKNYDGSALSEEKVKYGEAAQMASALTPVKPSADGKTYVFAGWSAELDSITKDTYAVAQYAVEGAENYWVTFVDTDGTVLYKTMVEEGGTAVYGVGTPVKEGYTFVGWDKVLSNITEDTTVTALYSKEGEQYVVTYVDWDDTFITSMIVNHGENAVAPAAPSREGDENTVYTFAGWDNNGENVTSNLIIKATYDVHTHEYNTFAENVILATCVSNRTDKFSCSCGLTKEIEVENSFDETNHAGTLTLTGEKAVGCTEDGYSGDLVCEECGNVAKYGSVITASGHAWSDWEVETPASCAADGVQKRVCANDANHIETKPIAATGEHVYATEVERVDAQCEEDGYVIMACACGAEEKTTLTKTGHTEEEIPATAPTCTEDGLTAGVKCSVCNEVLKAQETAPKLGHDMGEFVVTTPASCKAEGEKRSDCSKCDYFETQKIEKLAHTEEEIPATAPTCTEDGLTAGVKCSVCGEILTAQETAPKLGHDMSEFVVTTPATCTSEGEERSDCSRCDYFETRKIESKAHTEEEIPATAPTCTEDGLTAGIKCSVCGEVLKAQETDPKLGHTEEEIPAVAPDCINDGLTAGVKCSVCGEVLKAQETDPKLGHTEEEIPAVAPDCTTDGLTAGVKCSVCGEILTAQETDPKTGHDMGEYVVTTPATCTSEGEERADCSKCDYFETQKIEKLAHTEEEIPAVAPDCTTDGLTAGVKCSVCGEILTAQETDPKTGHDMGEYVVTTPATCTSEGEERADCSKCDYFETQKIEKVAHTEETIPAVAPDCTTDGLTAGVKCSVCGEILTAQETDPKTGHDMGEFVVTTPATCTAEGEERADCSKCDYFETRKTAKASHSWADADCTKPSTCTVCGETSGKEIGHDMGAYVVTTPATCTAEGEERSDCSRCDHFETRVVEKANHTEEEIPATAPTCTEDGLTAGIKCSVCGEVLKAQETDPKTGHDMGAYVVTTSATCTAEGEERSDCSRCDYFETKVIEKKAHTEEEIPAVAPTCTEDGLTAGIKCSVCGEVIKAQETDPKTGHDMGEFVVTTPATCTAKGEERSDCSRCDYFETREVAKAAHTEETIPAVEATCTATGLTEGVKCSVCGEILVAQTVVDKKAHTEEEIPAVEATCTATGLTEGVKCSVCGEILVAQTVVDKKPHTEETIPAVEATCTKTGLTEGTKCSVCGEILVAQTETSKLSHDMGEYVVTTEATCKAEGEERADCSACDYYETRVITKKAHTEETVSGKAPTCTEKGLTDGIKCSVCGETVVAQKKISAKGHTLGEWKEVKAPTCTEKGIEAAECSECDYVKTRETDTTDHDYNEDGVCKDCNAEQECIHICHRQHNIFARIVWSIIRGICSIFGLAKTCSCGAIHY